MLAPAHAQGSVVGTTATVGQSHLISAEEYGAPLFEDVAHSFCVQVYAVDLPDPGALDRVRAVIEREKPAHTRYHLCPIAARMRVGFQARLGIDAIVAGPPPDLRLDVPHELGQSTILSAVTGKGRPGTRLGEGARLGRSTRLA
jgi:hypothetical protein